MARSRRERRPLPPGFGIIWSTVAIDMIGFGIILPVLPLYAQDLGASPTTIGFLLATFSVAQLLCAPLWGRLSDRIGRKPVILVSLFGTALGSFITGGAGVLWLLFAGRLIDGASGASVSVAQAAVTDVAPPEERPRLLGLLGAAFGVGFVLGPALGALASFGGRHLPFYVAGTLALVNGLVAIRRLPETRPVPTVPTVPTPVLPDHDVDAPGELDATARRSMLTRLALAAFLSTAAFSAFEATLALLGEERFSLGASGISALFVGIGVALVLVQGGAVGPVTARFGGVGTLRIALAVNAAGLLVLAAATSWGLLLLALALLVVGQGLAAPSLSALVATTAHGERRGGALGWQQSAGGAARVVGPVMGGVLFEHVGVPVPYLVGAGLLVTCLAVIASLRDPAGLVVRGH